MGIGKAHTSITSIQVRVRNSILQITHNDAIKGRAGGKILSMSRSSALECCLGGQERLPIDRDGRHIEFSHNLSHSQRRGRWNSFCCIFLTMKLKCALCFSDVYKREKQMREITWAEMSLPRARLFLTHICRACLGRIQCRPSIPQFRRCDRYASMWAEVGTRCHVEPSGPVPSQFRRPSP